MRTAIFPASFDQLENIRDFITHAAQDAGMDESGLCAVEMAVDEACSNIIEHAYQGKKGEEIECTCDHDDQYLTIILRDHGKPFDVTAVPKPDLSGQLEDRKVGGLGIYMMQQLMDDICYERLEGSGNILTLVRKLQSPE